MPLISIIIPCYNAESYIMRCFNSLQQQTIGFENLELIFVDDASVDGTWTLLTQIEKAYPDQVIAIHSDENMRQGGARNLGLSYASGSYIGFVDSDDWVEHDMYQKMYEKISSQHADLVYCRHIRDHGTSDVTPAILEKRARRNDQVYVIDTEKKRADFIASGCIGYNVWDKLYHRQFLQEHPFAFPAHLIYEDIYFGSLVYLYTTKVCVLDEILYHYYVNETSTVLCTNEAKHYDLFQINELKWEFLSQNGFLTRYPDALAFDYIVTLYLTGCKIFSLRFETFPYEAFQKMKADILSKFPDFGSNPYISTHLNEFYQLLISFLSVPVDEKALFMIQQEIKRYFGTDS